MATTFTIPLTTLPVGSQQFGPASPADSETAVTLTLDRSVSGGLNSLTATSVLSVDLQQSDDAGVTWFDLGTSSMVGGIFIYKTGVTATSSVSRWNLGPGTSRQLRATITVAGTSIAVAGSIVTQ